MADNKSYLEIKVTFTHIMILLVSVILIGIFLFYIGFNAGKNENVRKGTFGDIRTETGKSDELVVDRNPAKKDSSDEPDIRKELGLFDKKAEEKKEKPAEIKITEPKKIPAEKKRTGNYTIQVGSFKSHLLAKNYAKKFTMMGYETDISQYQSPSSLWFRVKVGNFKTLQEADAEKVKLEKMEKRKFQTVKIK